MIAASAAFIAGTFIGATVMAALAVASEKENQ